MAILEEPIKNVPEVKNYINGEWVSPTGEEIEVVNPATGRVIARTRNSSRTDVNAAIEAAKEAFPAWRKTPWE